MSEDRCIERVLVHLRASQMAILYVMIESGMECPELPDDEMPGAVIEKETMLRKIEAYSHAEGRYDFMKSLVPAARGAMKRAGF
jgi:hypothetical protein